MAKQTLKQVGETMFPGISESYAHSKPRFSNLPISKLGNEIVTDLPLQICLFFNLCYFPFWLIISIDIAYVKVYHNKNYFSKYLGPIDVLRYSVTSGIPVALKIVKC